MPVTEIERRELVNRLVATIGEEPTETLMQCLLTEGRDQLATKDDLKAFATKDDLKAFATKDDLKAFATKDDLKAFATKEDLNTLEITLRAELASKEDLKAFATKEDLNTLEITLRAELASKEDLKAFATKDDLKMLEKVLSAESNERFGRLEALINTAMGKQMRIYIAMLVGVMLAIWGSLIVVAVG